VYLNPFLEGRPGARVRTMGFDPICALVADKDVARAVQSAVHAPRSGIYNVAGCEAVPLSVLARWTGRTSLPLPGALLGGIGWLSRLLRQEAPPAASAHPHLRYGFTLDTSLAERDLGFLPTYRVGLARAGDGSLTLETASV
jgi:nucleoside-diphosphate-sugar epimerase